METLWFQLADSAFPTGAFAYSNGLEAVARAGVFSDARGLIAYLRAGCEQCVTWDIPFLDAAHAQGLAGDTAAWVDLAEEWESALWHPSLVEAGLEQGRAGLDLLAAMLPGGAELAGKLRLSGGPLHWLPVLGYCLGAAGASLRPLRRLHGFMLVRDQIAAAVRLGLLGPGAAQKIQASLLAGLEAHPDLDAGRSVEEAAKSSPFGEVGPGCHGFLYSKLFRN